MIIFALEVLCTIFDGIILMIYFEGILGKRKKPIPLFFYWTCFLGTEFVTWAVSENITLLPEQMRGWVTAGVSLSCIFLLTFLYDARWRHRVFVTVSLQFYASFSEGCIYVLVPTSQNNAIGDGVGTQMLLWLFLAKLLFLIFVLCTVEILRRKRQDTVGKYSFGVIFTPICSWIVLVTATYPERIVGGVKMDHICMLVGLFAINVANYILFHKALENAQLRMEKEQLERQVEFQAKKYQQMSTAYRKTRSMLHDTKKHFFYIEDCLEKKEYDNVMSYLPEAVGNLEKSYNRINTGHLVIDAFLSNHLNMAESEGITFDTEVKINPENIQIEDYDFCVILGNLLDNSLEACQKITGGRERKIGVQIFTTDAELVIHIVNTREAAETEAVQGEKDWLYHGYGMKNVEDVVEKYHGNFSSFAQESSFENIVTIPNDVKKS